MSILYNMKTTTTVGSTVYVDGERGTVVAVDPDKGEAVKVRFGRKVVIVDAAVIASDERELIRD